MTAEERTSSDERTLRAGIEARVRAVREKDLEGLLRHYASDVVTFDLMPPFANHGAAGVRERLAQWFGSFETTIDYSIEKIDLTVSGEVAFDHHATHVKGTSRGGQAIDMWFRETVGYRRHDGQWKVTHQHSSVPFDMASGRPQLSLTP